MATAQAGSLPTVPRLRLWDTTSLIVGIIIGVGIYKTPSLIFAGTSSAWQAMMVWIVGGGFSFLGALCFAELASTYPRSGGEYVYLSRAFGPWTGFLFAWAQLAIIRAGSIGQIAYIFAQYTGDFFGLGQENNAMNCLIAAGSIVVLTAVNILGVTMGKNTQNVLTLLKIAGVGAILCAGFIYAPTPQPEKDAQSRSNAAVRGYLVRNDTHAVVVRLPDGKDRTYFLSPETIILIDGKTPEEKNRGSALYKLKPGARITLRTNPSQPQIVSKIEVFRSSALAGLASCLIFVLWTYAGWHEAAYVVSEVKDKQRTIPLSLLLGTGFVLLCYLLINLAYVAGLGFDSAGDTTTIAADVLARAFGERGGTIMSLLVIVSCLGAINGMIFTSSRIYVEMGADHPLLLPLSWWHVGLGTPFISLVVQGVLCLAFVFFVGYFFTGEDPFATLLLCTAAVFWIFFLLTGIALFILRWKDRSVVRPFKVPLYPLTPILFCLACAGMVWASVQAGVLQTLIGLGVLLAGVPLYVISRRMRKEKEGSQSL